jgi:hypothetical protein
MTQVFGDSVRDTWKRAGLAGLTTLWIRTVVDVVRSLFRAYVSETRDSMFKLAVGLSILYVCVLMGVVGYGSIKFGEYYQPPTFSKFVNGEFGAYRIFTVAAGFSLAMFLGAASALFGLWQKSLLHGGGALIAGTAFTIAAFQLLPTVWFPLDRYPVGAVWLMGGGVPFAACTCLVVTLLGRFGPARGRFRHS